MEVTYSLSPDDVRAFHQFHASGRGKLRWINTVSAVFLLCVWVLQFALVVRALYLWRDLLGYGPHAWRFLLMTHQHLLTTFGLITLFLLYTLWGAKWLSPRRVTDPAALAQPRTIRLAPEGVSVSAPGESLRRPWSEMGAVEADRARIYLYLGPANALVVPRRAFADPATARAFETEARAFRADPRLSAAGAEAAQGVPEGVWPPPPTYALSPDISAEADPLQTPVPGTVEAVYTTRPADLWRVQGRLIWRRPALLLPALVPYTLAAAVWTFPRLAPLPAIGLAAVIGIVGAAVTIFLTTGAAIRKRFEKFRGGRPCRTIARPDFICDVTPEGRTMLRWPTVAAIDVQGGDVIVRTKAGGGLVVPRSAFAGEAERAAFAEALRRYQAAGQGS